MQVRRHALLALFFLALPLVVSADGMYIPRAPRDPRSHTRDISEPTQKAVLVYLDGKERLILQVSYKGDASEFAWLVPTPTRPEVAKFDRPIFHELHRATAPRIKYWFDANMFRNVILGPKGAGQVLMAASPGPPAVEVLERSEVGFYDIAVLRARKSDELVTWLRANSYMVTPEITAVLGDYIHKGWVFTAARIKTADQGRVQERLGEGVLQSVQLTFDSPKPVYPLRVSSLNPGRTEVLLYAFCREKVDASPLKLVCAERALNWVGPVTTSALMDGFADSGLGNDEGAWYMTKLRGDLRQEDMTRDIILAEARSQEFVPVPDEWAPFLDNLGALSLMLIGMPLTMYVNAILATLCVLVGRTRFAARRSFPWTALGVVLLLGFVPVAVAAELLRKSRDFWPIGLVTLTSACVAAAFVALAWRRTRLRRFPRDA